MFLLLFSTAGYSFLMILLFVVMYILHLFLLFLYVVIIFSHVVLLWVFYISFCLTPYVWIFSKNARLACEQTQTNIELLCIII